MFERVAILVGIGDILYDSQIFDKTGNTKQDIDEATSYLEKLDAFDYKFRSWGLFSSINGILDL